MDYVHAYVAIAALCSMALIALFRHEAKRFPTNKTCPTCPPGVQSNYLTEEGICQECAWEKLADKMKNSYN